MSKFERDYRPRYKRPLVYVVVVVEVATLLLIEHSQPTAQAWWKQVYTWAYIGLGVANIFLILPGLDKLERRRAAGR